MCNCQQTLNKCELRQCAQSDRVAFGVCMDICFVYCVFCYDRAGSAAIRMLRYLLIVYTYSSDFDK